MVFNKDYFTVTFRQRWADFHALAPATSSLDSWFPHARALPRLEWLPILISFAKSSMAAFVSPSSIMEPHMSFLNVANGPPTLPQLLHLVASATQKRPVYLDQLSPLIDHLQRKTLHQLDKMDAEKRDSVLLHKSDISIYNCGLPLYPQLLSRSPYSAHPRLIRRFLTIGSGYLPRLCRNCKHFYPTLHHLISCPSNFLIKGCPYERHFR